MDAHRPRKMDKSERTERPYERLGYAVVGQACRDYRNALKQKKKKHPPAKAHHDSSFRVKENYYNYQNADYTIRECEYFFRNDISLWCDLDGEWIIRQIRGGVNNDSADD